MPSRAQSLAKKQSLPAEKKASQQEPQDKPHKDGEEQSFKDLEHMPFYQEMVARSQDLKSQVSIAAFNNFLQCNCIVSIQVTSYYRTLRRDLWMQLSLTKDI